jgi:hypothetical protein
MGQAPLAWATPTAIASTAVMSIAGNSAMLLPKQSSGQKTDAWKNQHYSAKNQHYAAVPELQRIPRA